MASGKKDVRETIKWHENLFSPLNDESVYIQMELITKIRETKAATRMLAD